MSDNTTQLIEDELTQRNIGLNKKEIEEITKPIRAKGRTEKFKRLLNGDIEYLQDQAPVDPRDGTPINPRDRGRVSLEGMGMFYTGDVEMTARLVACSEFVSEQADQEKIEALGSEIRYFDGHYEWGRFDENTDSGNNDSDDDDETNTNKEYSPQQRRSNTVSHPSHLNPDETRQREMRKTLLGI